MAYQPSSGRRVVKRRDNTPIILAILMLMALPALGFAVWKFVINKPPQEQPAEELYAGTPLPDPQEGVPPRAGGSPSGVYEPSTESSYSPAVNLDPFSAADGGMTDSRAATARACRKVKESVGLGKSLVIWLFDRTTSCDGRRDEVATQLEALYPHLNPVAATDAAKTDAGKSDTAPAADAAKNAAAGPDDTKLLSVVARFGKDVEYLTPAPTDDLEAIRAALGTVKGSGDGVVENTFGAIEAVVAKFGEYAALPHKRYITVVVVTDEVGNDQATRDKTLAAVQKLQVPVFVVGQSATFGSVGNQMAGEGKDFFQGPESRELDQPPIEGPYAVTGSQECGIGPYSLTHLCRESGGAFYAVTSLGGAPLSPRYFPRYMSEAEYDKNRATNKALVALIEAARDSVQNGAVAPFSGGETSFAVDEAGVPVGTDIERAQRPVALLLPAIDRLFEILKKGEADRSKLVEPRHQAAYDLAIGRIMAQHVRAEGYNILLAGFKSGRKGSKPDIRLWRLMPGEGIEKNSVLSGYAKKARDYLEAVIKNHPGTPWASAAQQELSQPIGWVWQES